MATATLSRRSSKARKTRDTFKVERYRVVRCDPPTSAAKHTLDWDHAVWLHYPWEERYLPAFDSRDEAMAEAAAFNRNPVEHEWAMVVEIGQVCDYNVVDIRIGSFNRETDKAICRRQGTETHEVTRDIRIAIPTSAEIKRHATPIS